MVPELLICAIVVTACISNPLPSNVKKCTKNQNDFADCLKLAVEDVLAHGAVANKEIGLPILEPLTIPSLVIGEGTGAVALQQNYKNVKVAGLSKIHCDSASMDFDKKILSLDCVAPQVIMSFDYDINGKILVLPVYGKGPAHITLDKLNFKLSFNLGEYDKKGKTYYKVSKQTLSMDPELIQFVYENLFDGDKALSDNVHRVLNENWQEAYADVKASYEEAFGQIFASLFNSVLGKVSAPELF